MRILSLLILMIFSFQALSQGEERSDDRTVTIKLQDGTILSGTILAEDDETIKLQSSYGITSIKRIDVASLTYSNRESNINDEKDNTYSSTHYLLTQSGYGLRKGQAYYENTYVLWNSYSHGFTDNFSLSLGGEVISLLVSNFPILFVTPKLSFPFKSGAFSLSTTIVTVPIDDLTTFGFLQGSLTLGDRQNNFTIGSGFGYSFSGDVQSEIFPIIISGMKQLSTRISIVSENWFVTDTQDFNGILSLGIRIHNRNNNNYLSVGLWRTTADQGPLLALPFISGLVSIK